MSGTLYRSRPDSNNYSPPRASPSISDPQNVAERETEYIPLAKSISNRSVCSTIDTKAKGWKKHFGSLKELQIRIKDLQKEMGRDPCDPSHESKANRSTRSKTFNLTLKVPDALGRLATSPLATFTKGLLGAEPSDAEIERAQKEDIARRMAKIKARNVKRKAQNKSFATSLSSKYAAKNITTDTASSEHFVHVDSRIHSLSDKEWMELLAERAEAIRLQIV